VAPRCLLSTPPLESTTGHARIKAAVAAIFSLPVSATTGWSPPSFCRASQSPPFPCVAGADRHRRHPSHRLAVGEAPRDAILPPPRCRATARVNSAASHLARRLPCDPVELAPATSEHLGHRPPRHSAGREHDYAWRVRVLCRGGHAGRADLAAGPRQLAEALGQIQPTTVHQFFCFSFSFIILEICINF
jgi:hypothetical protein